MPSKTQLFYTDERNTQIVIALLKAHGIRKIVANPGTTNISFVGSVQNDPWFEVYSGVDERHSAYLACGLAAESAEPVVLSCTGATASRNYLPALTEAYYRKLPILAITSLHSFDAIGQLTPQMLDRSISQNDVFVAKFEVRAVSNDGEERTCVTRVNAAIHALRRRGGGPVHINLEESGLTSFNTRELPAVRKIEYFSWDNVESVPAIPKSAKIALFVGAGACSPAWAEFVRHHNVAVFCSEEGMYAGPNRVFASLLMSQTGFLANPKYVSLRPDIIIDVGEVSGDYPALGCFWGAAPVWRVSPDGEVRDRFRRLVALFEMPQARFVERYVDGVGETSYYEGWKVADEELREQVPELPFSNPWIAKMTAGRIPVGSVIHFGILNSLRSWNLFPVRNGVLTSSNVGGFGIDGGVSTLIGASLAAPDKLHFGVFGDLAFFYDLNALGNRHIGRNLRILLVNNGCGSEFNMYFHPGSQFEEHANDYIAAGGHFGKKSPDLVRHYAQDLGFAYICATNKDEYLAGLEKFVSASGGTPIVFECFTNASDESTAHRLINSISPYAPGTTPVAVVKSLVPERVKNAIKELVK